MPLQSVIVSAVESIQAKPVIDMLNALPKDSQKAFGESSINSMKTTFTKARKREVSRKKNSFFVLVVSPLPARQIRRASYASILRKCI